MEIESETQLKSDNWQAISHQARIEQARSKLHLLETIYNTLNPQFTQSLVRFT